MTTPDWVQDAIFYQIFPDRFSNGDKSNDPPNVMPWNAIPTSTGFWGGDLAGISDHLDYLEDLGVNAIYLNPIFLASSNHRYNTTDYFTIDPKLGDTDDFRTLIHNAHKKGLRIILDGVFNHCGRGFFAFNDLLENQETSPYRDWFHIYGFPVEAYKKGKPSTYEAWWGFPSLPKFNTNNPCVRKYILQVARHWIDLGADGWRLDVPNEIDDDAFWSEFRSVVKNANPDAYLLGEIWDGNPRWVGEGHFDGLMNYPLKQAILDFMNRHIDAAGFQNRVEELYRFYPAENGYAMYNLLGSHDTERILTVLHGNFEQLKLIMLMQFAFIGAPAIYYGDEIGLTGGKDPECRKSFLWNEGEWNHEIREWTKSLCKARRDSKALRRGSMEFQHSSVPGTVVLERRYENELVTIFCNSWQKPTRLYLEIPELQEQSGNMETLARTGSWRFDFSHSCDIEFDGPGAGILRFSL